jgi:Family of unknown function (DUF6879)
MTVGYRQDELGVPESDRVEPGAIRTFLEGEPPDDSWFMDWIEYIQHEAGEGKRISRVRVVDDPPPDVHDPSGSST